MLPTALTIAGSDPSGGAGLQADLKTFHQHGVYGMSVVTLLTVQNTQTVSRVEMVDVELVAEQLTAVLQDIPPQTAKTGALGSRPLIESIAERAQAFDFPLVVDPVMISKHGVPLIDDEAVDAVRQKLLPVATLITPNLYEAGRLADIPVHDLDGMEAAARKLAALGPQHVLIKGGRANGEAVDLLYSEGRVEQLVDPLIETQQTHGTGCVLSAAITAQLAKGLPVVEAVPRAKTFVHAAIQSAPGLGQGYGPTNLFVATD